MDRIAVTLEDIAGGQRKSGSRCAVALALIRHFNAVNASASLMGLVVNETVDRYVHYYTPKAAADFITAYDAYLDAVPFEFELDAPHKIMERTNPARAVLRPI